MLDTKEFQGGIQTPLSYQLLKTFVNLGYSLDILLPLVVSQVIIGESEDRVLQFNSFELYGSELNNNGSLAGARVLELVDHISWC